MVKNVQKQRFLLLIAVAAVLLIIIVGSLIFFNSPRNEAKNVIEDFYELEQQSMYSKSWELFHPYMKEKVPREDYIESRPHLFMNHLDATNFRYEMESLDKVKDFTFEEGAREIDVVYRTTVHQYFSGKYGNFIISKNVYAAEVEEEDNWYILWDYS